MSEFIFNLLRRFLLLSLARLPARPPFRSDSRNPIHSIIRSFELITQKTVHESVEELPLPPK